MDPRAYDIVAVKGAGLSQPRGSPREQTGQKTMREASRRSTRRQRGLQSLRAGRGGGPCRGYRGWPRITWVERRSPLLGAVTLQR